VLSILAVDDDEDVLRYVTGVLERDHQVTACSSGEEALRQLGLKRFDLVLADLNMPPPDGFELLRIVQTMSPPPPVVVITAMDRARAAVEALRLGARDYLIKPAEPDEIRAAVARVAAAADTGGARGGEDFGLVGESPSMRRLRQLIPLLARSSEMVLVLGETGSGKELLSRALHEHGPRRDGPFVVHNMAATPAELAESIFLGHVRGAFTGAASDHSGLFEQAHGGTLFLDEVDSFPLALQAKLLRVLETHYVQRVGSATERDIDVRVISSSAVDLGELVTRGAFRADLYYRLRQLEVVMPPLRERPEDIPGLARHFLAELATQTDHVSQLAPAAMDQLMLHTWPGNCRELRNAVRSAALLAGDGPILPGHLPRSLQQARPGDTGALAPSALRSVERDHILQTLERAGGNRSRAARLLGIDRGTLARKLRSLGLDMKRKS
jgi:DNA-binding NtrC family response regulator